MDPTQIQRVVLDASQLREMCKKWAIPYEERPPTRTIAIGQITGPIDLARLPDVVEARSDIQLLMSTYMETANTIIEMLRGEDR